MAEQNAPLEELLEAAEAQVSRPVFSPRMLVWALVTTFVLLVVVSVTLAVASGGQWGQEPRLLQFAVPRHATPAAYRSRIRIADGEVRFVPTPFGTQELHVTGVVQNRGGRVLDRADLSVTLSHLFRDETFEYSFEPVTPSAEGIGNPGPLLAQATRPFHYRIAEFPADIERRDVRVRWGIGAVAFQEGLAIPLPLPDNGP